jgi:hypothetical protein
MISKKLPAGFEDLEYLVPRWALPTETQRNRLHLSCSFEEIKEYYDALLARAEAIIAHLQELEANGRPSSIPQESKNLFYLLLSLAEVSQSVEIHGQVGVVDGFPAERWFPEHEDPDWRALETRLRPMLA